MHKQASRSSFYKEFGHATIIASWSSVTLPSWHKLAARHRHQGRLPSPAVDPRPLPHIASSAQVRLGVCCASVGSGGPRRRSAPGNANAAVLQPKQQDLAGAVLTCAPPLPLCGHAHRTKATPALPQRNVY